MNQVPTIDDPSILRFPCPCCGNVLTLPAHLANVSGPCPKCRQEIISPDPARHLVARPAADPAPPSAAVPPSPDPSPVGDPAPAPATGSSCSPVWRWIACTAPVLTFIAGLFVGRATLSPAPARASASRALPPPAAKLEVPPSPSPPRPVEPLPRPGSAPPLLPPPSSVNLKALSSEEVLQRFVQASRWQERLPYVRESENIGPILKAYAEQMGDGPMPVKSILFVENVGDVDRFNVITERFPAGFPVAIFLTPEGPRVDWDTFVGFYHDLFREFSDGPAGRMGAFDVYLKPIAQTPVEQAGYFERYALNVPMPGRERQAFVKKDSAAHAQILALLQDDGLYPPDIRKNLLAREGLPVVLELAKLENANGPYLQITSVVAKGWGLDR